MIDFPALRVRVARHAMEGRALAGELRSYVAAEEARQVDLMARAIRHETAGEDDAAEAMNDESNALEERLDAVRALRDTVNEAVGSIADEVAELDACGQEGMADAARH